LPANAGLAARHRRVVVVLENQVPDRVVLAQVLLALAARVSLLPAELLSRVLLSAALLSEALAAAPEQLARAALGALSLAASLSKARVAMLETPALGLAVRWPAPDSFWLRVPTMQKQAAPFGQGRVARRSVCLKQLGWEAQMATSRRGERASRR
jgi:hypothetical protein